MTAEEWTEFLDDYDGVWYDRFGLWATGKRSTAWIAEKLSAAGVCQPTISGVVLLEAAESPDANGNVTVSAALLRAALASTPEPAPVAEGHEYVTSGTGRCASCDRDRWARSRGQFVHIVYAAASPSPETE